MNKDNSSNLEKEVNIDKYLQPALLIALITAISYYIGYSYTSGYLGRLGIKHEFIEFTATYYFLKSIIGVTIGFIILFFIWFYKRSDTQNKIFRSALDNIFSLIVAAILIYQGILEENNSLFILSAFLILFYFISVYDKSIINFKSNPFAIIGIGFICISLMSSIASFFGRNDAISTIEGRGIGITFIKIKTKANIDILDNTKNFILIMHNDKKYYIIEKRTPASLNPLIYVIPDDQVELVVLTGSKSGKKN
jgi:hypothetical protein